MNITDYANSENIQYNSFNYVKLLFTIADEVRENRKCTVEGVSYVYVPELIRDLIWAYNMLVVTEFSDRELGLYYLLGKAIGVITRLVIDQTSVPEIHINTNLTEFPEYLKKTLYHRIVMKTILKYYVFRYQLPPLSGIVLVYEKKYEIPLQTATIQLRNRLKMQLPLGYEHFSLIGVDYREIDDN